MIKYQRFDNIAGAIQSLTEDLILKWIKYWIMKTGVRNISLSGGVFMNVKACQRIVDANIADNIYVMPSAADESTSIGAAFYGAIQNDSKIEVQPIKDLYLGKEYLEEEIVSELDASCVSERYEISQPDNINCTVAKLLSEDKVVARYAGRMEFGARALGNRSILANPRSFETIELINSSIKSRDFWMPFTPSVLDVDMDRYIVDHKKIFAPYMCVTFNTTELAQQHLKAAIHPRDKTARPQCVLRSWNPGYYELIEEFKKITGIGAVLNTSFNLHGEPNVCSPRDAIHTMDNSELKYLAMGSFLIVKKTEIN